MRRSLLFLCLVLTTIAISTTAKADKRLALVIGNSIYRKDVPRLVNPANDATDVDAALKRLGFETRRVLDGDYDTMRRAIGEFTRQAGGADMAVVFYAGHGMEIAGENWLIPVDAELQSDTAAETEAINLKTLTLSVSNASRLGLVILDACRNNPFAARMQRTNRTREVERGFGRVEPANNVLVMYAAKDGTTASDGSGRNSPFSQALLGRIETPGLEIVQMFRSIRDDVLGATRGQQQPFVYGSPSAQLVYLKPPAAGPSMPQDETNWQILQKAVASREFDGILAPQTKLALEAELLKQFLQGFPKSAHAPEATTRLATLEKLIRESPAPAPVNVEEVDWQNIVGLRTGKIQPQLPAAQRLEVEKRVLEEFIRTYPQTRRRAEIGGRLAELKSLIASNPTSNSDEEQLWYELTELDAGRSRQKITEDQRLVIEQFLLNEFITRFPDSRHKAAAQAMVDRLNKMMAAKLNSPVATGNAAPTPQEQGFVDSLRAKPAQLLSRPQREKLADIAGRRATLDLEISFEYNSAEVGAQARPVLQALGRVLAQDQFRNSIFLVGGHTDSSGGDEYNLELSARRAEAVKRLLIDEFKLPVASFIVAGFGKDYPKNKSKPLADENRRVAIVNMSGR